ncbi:splicing factor U2af large subunit A [Aegilops tauschii subsp. strangulata]|uniref:splicing factor U2af large subunit A n=1 Tax=Aegilops tauschii subsp. strangulata TaxID=200361 RepID=UPI001ABCFC87
MVALQGQLPELPAADPGMFPNMLPNTFNLSALGQPLPRHSRLLVILGVFTLVDFLRSLMNRRLLYSSIKLWLLSGETHLV